MSVSPQLRDFITSQLATAHQGDKRAFIEDVVAVLKEPMRAAPTSPRRAPKDTPVIIELRDVTRSYKLSRKNIVEAVKGVSLEIHQGEIVALTGPSGSGKSTLMHLIGGLDKPTNGEVSVSGVSLAKMNDKKLAGYRNKTIGLVFQFFYLQPFLRVSRNVEVPLMFARTKRKQRRAMVDVAVQGVGLEDRASHLPKELSGGQMQRVAIARALVNQPKILLADEPTGNLDSQNSQHIMELLRKIRDEQGTTIVIVTHDSAVAAMADRTIELRDGVLV